MRGGQFLRLILVSLGLFGELNSSEHVPVGDTPHLTGDLVKQFYRQGNVSSLESSTETEASLQSNSVFDNSAIFGERSNKKKQERKNDVFKIVKPVGSNRGGGFDSYGEDSVVEPEETSTPNHRLESKHGDDANGLEGFDDGSMVTKSSVVVPSSETSLPESILTTAVSMGPKENETHSLVNTQGFPFGKVLFYFPKILSESGGVMPSVIGVPLDRRFEHGQESNVFKSLASTEAVTSQIDSNRVYRSHQLHDIAFRLPPSVTMTESPTNLGELDENKRKTSEEPDTLAPRQLFSCVSRYGCRMGLVCVDGVCQSCDHNQECLRDQICVPGKPLIKFAMGLSLGLGSGSGAEAGSKVYRSMRTRQKEEDPQSRDLSGLEKLIEYMEYKFPEGSKRCIACGQTFRSPTSNRFGSRRFESPFQSRGLGSRPPVESRARIFEHIPLRIQLCLINLSPLTVDVLDIGDITRNRRSVVLATLEPPARRSDCKSWTEVTVSVDTRLEVTSVDEPKRQLLIGGAFEPRVAQGWSFQDHQVCVPIACQRHKFDLVEQEAYMNDELNDWCY